jgi:Flp pilus assembly CpaE family ATPase
MFRTIIVAEDTALSNAAQAIAFESGCMHVAKVVDHFPHNEYEAALLLSHHEPEIVLLEAKKAELALAVGEVMRTRRPDIAVLSMGGTFKDGIEIEFARYGILPLKAPVTGEALAETVRVAMYQAHPAQVKNLFLFVPAKAGSGASTVVLNTANSMARDWSHKPLVIEADLHSGVLALLLNIRIKKPILDTLHTASSLDIQAWEERVSHGSGFDLLLTDRVSTPPLPTWANYHQLVRFASPRYDALLVDLPEVVNAGTADLVHYASKVFIVCTPELPALTLAGQRLMELEARGLNRKRASVIVNRWHRGDISTPEIEDILKIKVATVIRNDYRSVHMATMAGSAVKPTSELGKSFHAFAGQLLEKPVVEPATRTRILLETFAKT